MSCRIDSCAQRWSSEIRVRSANGYVSPRLRNLYLAKSKKQLNSVQADQPALIARTSAARSSTGIIGKFARAFNWQTAEVIHDRLPFLDLPNSVIHRPGGDTSLIYRTRRRQ